MLIYENRVRTEFLRFREYLSNVRKKFHKKKSRPDDLLLDVISIRAHYERLNEMLPDSVKNKCSAGRHISFMEIWLKKNNREACIGDIDDLCERDIAELEDMFNAWCKNPEHYDSELVEAIAELLAHRQLDSAIRKAFVVLKERLCKISGVSRELDGIDLVNKIFGKNSNIGNLGEAERQSMRDLLAGLYGVFRNRFAHRHEEPSWAETDAIISMLNHILQELTRIK